MKYYLAETSTIGEHTEIKHRKGQSGNLSERQAWVGGPAGTWYNIRHERATPPDKCSVNSGYHVKHFVCCRGKLLEG